MINAHQTKQKRRRQGVYLKKKFRIMKKNDSKNDPKS